MDIIKTYFRDPDGDYVLFGDVKQNIYGQPTEKKDVVTNVRGVNELQYCYRSDFKVRDLAQSFQKNIFGGKYDIDDFLENGGYDFFGQRQEKEGYINYMYLTDQAVISTLYNIIRGNILNKSAKISPNDITILGYTTKLLRSFDAYYRYASREKTNSMIESIETMYMTHISKHFAKKLFPNRTILYDNDIIKLRQLVARLFTIYDLTQEFENTFNERLNEECEKSGISYEAFLRFRDFFFL